MAVTLKQIAGKAGVSLTTVSFALRGKQPGKRRLSPVTVERILKVADEMGYRPNHVAASLAGKRTYTIGVLVTALRGDFYERVLFGIKKEVYPKFSPVLAVHNYNSGYEKNELENFISKRIDGVIAAFSGHAENIDLYREIKEKYNIPIVLLDRRIPGLELPLVRPDHFDTSHQAVNSLFALGHRNITYIGGADNLEYMKLFHQGYQTAMTELGIKDNINIISQSDVHRNQKVQKEFAAQIISTWEQSSPQPTALLVINDWLAYEILGVCQDRGIKVPDDLSVMGLDDCSPSELPTIGLSSVWADQEKVGRNAAKLLLERIEIDTDEPTRMILPVHVRMRKTTRPL